MPLFTIDPRSHLHLFTARSSPVPGPGWTLVSLVPDLGEDPDATGPQLGRAKMVAPVENSAL